MPRQTYVLRRDASGEAQLVEVERDFNRPSLFPTIWSDIPDYKSPLGTGTISGRAARREEMKRHNVRAADPSEYKPMSREESIEKQREYAKSPLHVNNRKPVSVDISNTKLAQSIAKKG